ncbi:MAG: AIR synthase-related protein, partial [Acidimicrobiaceae bacterium]|nr:AIR synthase-related protein [Acidimicrobiaceae bacterium]
RRYRAPFVSGKDSLYNEFEGEAVGGTLLISAVGVVRDLHRATTSALTGAGHDLWLVGQGSHHLGGSLVAAMLDSGDTSVPAPVNDPLARYRAVHRLIAEGRVTAAHDVSDGGVAPPLAEMSRGDGLGLRAAIPWDFHPLADAANMDERNRAERNRADEAGGLIAALFNEAPGQLVLESPAAERAAVAAALGGIGRRVGTVTGTGRIEIRVEGPTGMGAQPAQMNLTVEAARRAFGCDPLGS